MKKHEFVFERTLDAPLDLVWEVHTRVEHLLNWWGPVGMKMECKKMEFKSGGTFHFSLMAPDGSTMWAKFCYREISPKTRLVFVMSFADEHEKAIKYPMLPDWPLEVLNSIDFVPMENQTKIILRGTPLNAQMHESELYGASHESMEGGFGSSYSVLENYLETI